MNHLRLAAASAVVILAIAASLGTGAFADGNKLTPQQTEECLATGGRVDYVGLLRNEMCKHRYPDAGKSCSSSSECLGGCLPDQTSENYAEFSRRVQKGLKVPGRCAPETQSGFGCGETIEGGHLKSTGICVD